MVLDKEILTDTTTDSLTGLILGKQLQNDLTICLNHSTDGYMLIFDVDNLAEINVQKGRGCGDAVLKKIATSLTKLIKDWDHIYRLDGDRFAALLLHYKHEEIVEFCQHLNKLLEPDCFVSIGATHFDDEKDPLCVTQRSEVALKNAKNNFKTDLVFFSETGYQEYLCKVNLQSEMRNSVRNGCKDFFLCYQPIINGKDYSLQGAEALLRYNSPTKGIVSPAKFIPILEETEMICPVGMFVLREAAKQCLKWRKLYPHFRMNINVSYIQLRQPGFPQDVLDALSELHVPGEAVTLELTESMHLHDFNHCNEIFSLWENAGIHIAVDDFGTGYSSLSYLKKLHFNSLKVDQYFVSGITETPYNYKLISNVLDLANFSNIDVCLEGVETEEQLQVIHDLRADSLQGFIFSKPVVAHEFEEKFLDKQNPAYTAYAEQKQHFASMKRSNRNHSHLFWAMANGEPGYDVVSNNREAILRRMHMGLWITRFTKDKSKCEMFIDANCADVFGLDKPLPPQETYWFWKNRVAEECREYVNEKTRIIVEEGKMVQLEYAWQHPKLGRVRVRCVSVRASDSDGMITIKGYHRIISDIETTTFEQWQAEKQALVKNNKA